MGKTDAEGEMPFRGYFGRLSHPAMGWAAGRPLREERNHQSLICVEESRVRICGRVARIRGPAGPSYSRPTGFEASTTYGRNSLTSPGL